MKKVIALIVMIVALFGAIPAMAIDEGAFNPICTEGGLTENQKIEAGCDTRSKQGMSRITNLVNVAIGISGVVAVVVIVFGGQRYLTSAGDAGKAKQAKDMILYGVIGVVVAGLAWAVVNFIIAGVSSDTSSGGGNNGESTQSQGS